MICEIAHTFTSFPQREIFVVAVAFGFFFFDYIAVPIIALITNRTLPDKAVRKATLTLKDHIFVNINRFVTFFFVYFSLQVSCSPKYFRADLESLAGGMPGSGAFDAKRLIAHLIAFAVAFLPAAFLVYDFGYTIFHRILHYNWLYPYIHKHHHLQYCPFRGNVDAINVHPFEYLVGEFNHLFTVTIVSVASQKLLGYTPHNLFVLLYIVIAAILSTLNHTRVDVRIPYLYSVWWHDLHHRFPPCNYGQYSMFWDYVFSWYLPEETRTIVGQKRLDGAEQEVNGDGSLVVLNNNAGNGGAAASLKSPARPSLVNNINNANTNVAMPATPAPSQAQTPRSSSARKKKQ